MPQVDVAMISSATNDHPEPRPVFVGTIEVKGIGGFHTERGLGASLASDKLIALLGRDALKDAVLVYNGSDASFSLSV